MTIEAGNRPCESITGVSILSQIVLRSVGLGGWDPSRNDN